MVGAWWVHGLLVGVLAGRAHSEQVISLFTINATLLTINATLLTISDDILLVAFSSRFSASFSTEFRLTASSGVDGDSGVVVVVCWCVVA
jgi:hypothetical protein